MPYLLLAKYLHDVAADATAVLGLLRPVSLLLMLLLVFFPSDATHCAAAAFGRVIHGRNAGIAPFPTLSPAWPLRWSAWKAPSGS